MHACPSVLDEDAQSIDSAQLLVISARRDPFVTVDLFAANDLVSQEPALPCDTLDSLFHLTRHLHLLAILALC